MERMVLGKALRAILFSGILLLSLLRNEGECQDVVIKDLHVPTHATRFSDVVLTCRYETEKDPLYVRWYHNDLEFFKYAPWADSPINVFDDEGFINVSRTESTGEKVVLRKVDLSASGSYTCTVTGEKPNYTKVNATKNMTVVVIPDKEPSIKGAVKPRYSAGDTVNLTCAGAPSIPVATLSWYINEKKAPDEYLQQFPPEKTKDGLFVAKLLLNFNLSQTHIVEGELKLKCVASISTMYRESNEHSQQEPPTNKEVRNLPEEGSLTTTGAAGSTPMLGSLSSTLLLPVVFLLCLNLLH